jgi:hypothetical protein
MEHPLIANLEDLSAEQCLDRIAELHKKLAIAARSGNGHMCDQIRMAIESFQNQYQIRTRRDDGATPFADVIDIS